MIVLLKRIYRKTLRGLEAIPVKLELLKTWIVEWYAIYRKAPLYRHIKWTKEQKNEFGQYWMQVYGKKISNRWHRLYQAISGRFCVEYIPEMLYTTRIEPKLNDYYYAKVLEDKSLLETLVSGTSAVVPETILLCSNGQLLDRNRCPLNAEAAARKLSNCGEVVIKLTIGSSSGKGILFKDYPSKVEAEEVALLCVEIGKDFIIQKKIKPHPVFRSFNAASINTIRITTYLTEDKVWHAPIAFRVGRLGKNVDNIHSGGIGVGVKDDGSLLPVAYELGHGDQTKTYDKHPDSGVTFSGAVLPCMRDIIRISHELHGRFLHTGIISWDFTVNDDNAVVLVEANIFGQGIWFPQIIHGEGAFGHQTERIFQKIKR